MWLEKLQGKDSVPVQSCSTLWGEIRQPDKIRNDRKVQLRAERKCAAIGKKH